MIHKFRTPNQKRHAPQRTEQLHIGALPKGPQCCIQCLKPFKPGEAWRKLTSPTDPEFGSYSVGVHVQCPKS